MKIVPYMYRLTKVVMLYVNAVGESIVELIIIGNGRTAYAQQTNI